MKKNRLLLVVFIVVVAIAAWMWFERGSGSMKIPLKDFAVSDTGAIDKIFLADRDGNKVLLERISSYDWKLNGKYRARTDGVNTLLYTIKTVEVKSPVGKNLYDNTMKLLASSGIKAEIYQKGNLVKTYYVGHPTMDNLGTFMYMEGSSVPFIMHIPGFNGYLSTRYNTSEESWRDRSVFKLDPRSIRSVKIEDFSIPENSFSFDMLPDSSYRITQVSTGKFIPNADPAKMREFLNAFQSINYQLIDKDADKSTRDSIVNSPPFTRVSVTMKDELNLGANLYRKPVTENSNMPLEADSGYVRPWDLDKFYLNIPGDTVLYVCQYYHFKKILKEPSWFVSTVQK